MDAVRNYAISLVAENQKGILRDIGAVCAEHNANIILTQQETVTRGPDLGYSWVDTELEDCEDVDNLISALRMIPGIR